MDQGKHKDFVKKLSEELFHLLGDHVDEILLYGSYARGDATEASDIDILVVIREPFSYPALLKRTSELVAKLSLENDVVVSRAFITKDRFRTENSPFMMNVRREGIPI